MTYSSPLVKRVLAIFPRTLENLNRTVQLSRKGYSDADIDDIRLYLAKQLPMLINTYRKRTTKVPASIREKYPDETKIMEEYWMYEEKLRRYYQWNMQKGFRLLEEYGQYLFL